MTKDQAVLHFGSQAALARALGITRGSVHNWDEIPIGRQFQIEVVTDGALLADRQQEAVPVMEPARDAA